MSKALLSDLVAPKAHDLLAIAILSNDDKSMVPVLGDAVLEMGWRHASVMPMVLGMDLVARMPPFATDREEWRSEHARSIACANEAWDMYLGRHPAWARAVLAALLFGDWLPPMRGTPYPNRTCSPWRVVRSLCLRQSRPSRVRSAAQRAERRTVDEARRKEDLAALLDRTRTPMATLRRDADGGGRQ